MVPFWFYFGSIFGFIIVPFQLLHRWNAIEVGFVVGVKVGLGVGVGVVFEVGIEVGAGVGVGCHIFFT